MYRNEVKEALKINDHKKNASYHAARESKGNIEARITNLDKRLDDALIVESGTFESVALGIPTRVKNLATGKERIYTVVGSEEIEFTDNAASEESPVGQVLLGKKVGDIAEVQGPNGIVQFEILSIGA